jgi:hypothetical protein
VCFFQGRSQPAQTAIGQRQAIHVMLRVIALPVRVLRNELLLKPVVHIGDMGAVEVQEK